MQIDKDDVIKLMKETIKHNWLFLDSIDEYERAINLICGGVGDKDNIQYEGQAEDLEKIMLHINDFSDFKIQNVYEIIYKHQPWNFMKRIAQGD